MSVPFRNERLFGLLLGLVVFAAGARARAEVPKIMVDATREVDEWWSEHPFNPHSPRYAPDIKSPEPIINVAEVHGKHPESRTAGIDEALALLPEEGGTLFFPKSHGPYVITKEPVEERNPGAATMVQYVARPPLMS